MRATLKIDCRLGRLTREKGESVEDQMEWSTPDFDEVILNCEVAAYAMGDYDTEPDPDRI